MNENGNVIRKSTLIGYNLAYWKWIFYRLVDASSLLFYEILSLPAFSLFSSLTIDTLRRKKVNLFSQIIESSNKDN